jgi:arginase
MEKSKLCIITSDWEYGAGKLGTSTGPKLLLNACSESNINVLQGIPVEHIDFDINNKVVAEFQDPSPFLKRGETLLQHQSRVADTIESALISENQVLYLSGDHSNAIGGIAGFCRAFNPLTSGIIWIDAHLDLHTPFTTPSGNIHGMALNTALESNNEAYTSNNIDSDTLSIWNKIKSLKKQGSVPSENIVFIGIRSYEEQEIALVKELGIQVFFAEEVHNLGIENIINLTIKYLESKTESWYVSFDVDSLDPTLSKGTGTPVENGLQLDQAKPLINNLWNHPKTQCFEVTEINRELDPNNDMVEVICALLKESIQ